MRCRIAINGLGQIGCRTFRFSLVKHPNDRDIAFARKTARQVTVKRVRETFKVTARGRQSGRFDLSGEPLASTAFRDPSHFTTTVSQRSSWITASSKLAHGTSMK